MLKARVTLQAQPAMVEPNLAPLIDVLLVLFVVFLGLVLLDRMSIPTQVPAASSDPPAPQMVLELSDTGYLINDQPVPKDRLGEMLRMIYTDRPIKLLFLKVSPNRTYREAVEAMAVARGNGVHLIGLVPKGR